MIGAIYKIEWGTVDVSWPVFIVTRWDQLFKVSMLVPAMYIYIYIYILRWYKKVEVLVIFSETRTLKNTHRNNDGSCFFIDFDREGDDTVANPCTESRES